jgi:hypothetical protein
MIVVPSLPIFAMAIPGVYPPISDITVIATSTVQSKGFFSNIKEVQGNLSSQNLDPTIKPGDFIHE